MLTPLRSVPPFEVGPPKRSLLDRSPLPVPAGGAGGVGRTSLGVAADDEDLDDGFLISGGAFGASHVRSISIAPSIAGTTAVLAMLVGGGGDFGRGGCGNAAGVCFGGVGERGCERTNGGCCMLVCGK